jgi:hypothetical protein
LTGSSVQSTTGGRGVSISGSNTGYTVFQSSVKGTGYSLHSPVSPSLPRPCFTVGHHISAAVYFLPAELNSYALVTCSVITKYLNQNSIPFVILAKCFETPLCQEQKSRLLTRDSTYDGSRGYPLIWGHFWGFATIHQWPMASFIPEVSRPHTMTHHSRQDSP